MRQFDTDLKRNRDTKPLFTLSKRRPDSSLHLPRSTEYMLRFPKNEYQYSNFINNNFALIPSRMSNWQS